MNKANASVLELAQAAGLPTERFPRTDQEADIAEDLLAKEMDKLSMQEHEEIAFDVHGFCNFDDEDAATVNLRLLELETELQGIKDNKEAYTLARNMNEKYVTDRDFCIMFLRREKFNVKAAAALLVHHFQVKRQLFGEGDILGRDIRQSDLSPTDLLILKSGYYQVLPTRDAAERLVLLVSTNVEQCQGMSWDEGSDVSFMRYFCFHYSAIPLTHSQPFSLFCNSCVQCGICQ